LAQLGQQLVPHAGLPELFNTLQDQVRGDSAYRKYAIDVEHYILSSGLRQMISGSAFRPMVTGVWACEFVEELPYPGYLDRAAPPAGWTSGSTPVIQEIGYQLDNTSKTRAIFAINKGCNFGDFGVNDFVPDEYRRIPFENMVYIADGISDVPVFSVINHYGGRTYGVYDPADPKSFREDLAYVMLTGP